MFCDATTCCEGDDGEDVAVIDVTDERRAVQETEPKIESDANAKKAPEKTAPVKTGPVGPDSFVIKVKKERPALKLGMRIDYSDKDTLKVTQVKEAGAVADWNKKNADMIVEVGDYILEVNGKAGAADFMLEQISSTDTLTLQIKKKSAVDGQR